MASNIKVTLELDNKQYIANINTAKERTESFAKSADEATAKASRNFNKIADSAGVALGKLKSLAAAYVGIASIRTSLGFAAELDALSKATDVSIPKILALDAALAAAGGQSGKAGDFISELQKKLYEASLGSAEAQESFLRLGFSFREMGNLTPEQALQKTITQLSLMENTVQRNAIAQKLLGDAAKNIDWASVAQDYEKNAEANKDFAAAAAKSAQVLKDIQKVGQDLKIVLTTLLEPFLDLYKYVGQLVGGAGGGVMNALAFAFKAVALGAATVGASISALITDFKTLIELAPAVWARDWDKAGQIIEGRNKQIESSFEDLKAFIDKIDLFGDKAKEAANLPKPPAPLKPGGIDVGAYYAKEVEALKQLSAAYIQNAATIESNINLERRRIADGEDSIAVMTALRDITANYNKTLLDINAKIAQESIGPQTTATAAKIAQLKEERDLITKTYNEQLEKVPALIRLRQQEITMSKAVAESANETRDAFSRMIDKQAELSKIGASPLQKELIGIQAEADKAAKSLIELEAQRKFGADYIINRDQFIDPRTGAYLDQTMEEFRQKIISVYQTKSDLQKKDLEEIRNAQRSWNAGWQEAFATYVDNATNAAKNATSLFEKFSKGWEDALVNFVKTGKLSFKDLANSIIEEMVRIQARKLFAGIFGGATGGGGGGGILSDIFGAIAGKANGGPVSANTPYIIGEQGPELFVPKSAGTVVPNNQLSGSTQVTYNINAVDAASFRQMLAKEPEFLYAVTERGRSSIPGGRR